MNDEVGIQMRHARVIPDIEQTIVDTVNECRAAYDYVFTTGGIGPTHDDITAESVAAELAALNADLDRAYEENGFGA